MTDSSSGPSPQHAASDAPSPDEGVSESDAASDDSKTEYGHGAAPGGWRGTLHEVIFESDTPAGKAFDVALIATISLSVLVVMLDSVASIHAQYGRALIIAEWIFTVFFTIEYALRLLCAGRPWRYATSFYGIIDLLAILPTYIGFFFPGARYLLVVRIMRVLRVFRVLKLAAYLGEADVLSRALRASRRKITVFLFAVLTATVIIGSLMYVIEGPENGFTSIPRGIYWAIVTLTTVGFGDVSPQTPLGQLFAAAIMILGYGIIAVPTGIVTSELSRASAGDAVSGQACPSCGRGGHASDAAFCKYCGTRL